jgi:predicted ribosome quality control (RQC) complex YloA/Tae2 family protein
VGYELVEAYTQQKDVCTLVFIKNKSTFYVHVSVEHSYGTVEIVDVIHRARKNTIDVFPMCIGKMCTGVLKVVNDRIISFWLDDVMINVCLFSGGSGNVVVTRDGEIIDALHDKSLLIGTQLQSSDHKPQLGKWYQQEIEKNPDALQQCLTTNQFYVLSKNQDILFSLIPLTDWNIELVTENIFEAIHRVVSARRNKDLIASLKKQLSAQRKQDFIRLQRSIQGITEKEDTSERANQYRTYGNLLLSTDQPDSTGMSEITIMGLHDDLVTIPLQKNISVIENANRYFEKAKKAERAAEATKAKLPSLVARLKQIENELLIIEQSNNAKELEKLMRNTQNKLSEPSTKFREFQLDEGYMLYVGRNASNNDELTMRFAKPNDLWFHARGVSGSHAVLRMPEGTSKPPKKVLEAAASAAAYYSGARNAKYVPVVYTEKKHVRKFKGANVGAVTLERETVIMVPPVLPDSPGE